MKATGVVRTVDQLGRLVLPIELRRNLNIDVKDSLEIYVDGDMVVLKKYEPSCIFCRDGRELKHFEGKNAYSTCVEKLNK
ncbi:AbrB/MazE/SpoVT family DNA-binding domain-containing protein [Tepidibacter aestuarii]|uniref:AbrB/MazE/SpoVT family DNA-binding domain-containing protein n=1 Tax=Tepidibacter aestuarii TaxID=2925782 RepID=UPI0020C02EC2|nr:AbrB/MazE/SpoVT family DNA-binding domain-containing protein [Tepidibacter aestuarii]CAH2213209.1 AbrB family transcriptional regulator, transcriptional pleiotropic regulator of transition state genes [Tepidibacter aestuarii]